ncbi:MAG: MBL fold metallo-hydrolase [Bacteroidales bacterium]|nr:MBL fold metallo-hydrolase [Bacteroidales bacterium]
MDGQSLLLDTGQTDKYVKNAIAMGIDIANVDAIVLSHGHYDHAGGISFFPSGEKKTKLYLGPDATRRRYSLSTAMLKPNGFPKPEMLDKFDVTTIKGIVKISDTTTLFTLPNNAPANDKLVTDAENGGLIPDTFNDEVFTLIRHKDTTVLFGGCTHHGLEQLLTFCKDNLDVKELSLFIGGLHLSGRDAQHIENEAQKIKNILPVRRWIVNHCTGEDAISYWSKNFACEIKDGYAGSQITI